MRGLPVAEAFDQRVASGAPLRPVHQLQAMYTPWELQR